MNPQNNITKSVGRILKDNICTAFNFLNFMIAIALACVGAWTNMLFILVIITNTAIGIAQEIKAKKLVEKLSLLSEPTANIGRNGERLTVGIGEVLKGDILFLESGNTICADSVVRSGELEVNESLLTGESDPVIKKPGDSLLSGSSVISGKCEAEIVHTGDENYASQIVNEVKKSKGLNSDLLRSMRRVTKFTGWLIVPLGVILFLQAYFLRDASVHDAVVSTSAGLLGMLPKGLVLMIGIGLATGIIRLSKRDVLVHDLYSLENLAHVDVICLDKTGTLTEGKMKVESVYMADNKYEAEFKKLIGAFLGASTDNNATFQAMKAFFPTNDDIEIVSDVPFSSERKWSGVTFSDGRSFVLGAPEKLCASALPPEIENELRDGKRVLAAGLADEIRDKRIDPEKFRLLAAIVITDPIRENAVKAVSYFRNEDVDVKVISGDNPLTVSAVARKAGIRNADKYIDMSMISDEDIPQVAREYTVFGRVRPEQKRTIVSTMQAEGHNVAMTGDGVNDLLAMKQADCSIAVGQGTDAARQTAQIVLLDSDFSKLRDVLSEGRRVVNNITKSAGVFFIKTIYSILITMLCIIFNCPFPFIPIQITLIDAIIEGYPAFIMSFEPNDVKVRGRFLNTALRTAAPNAIAVTLSFCVMYPASNILNIAPEQTTLIMYLIVGITGIIGVIKACMPFNKLRAFLAATTAAGFFAALILFRSLLKLPVLNVENLPILVVVAAAAILIACFIKLPQKSPLKKATFSRT